MSKSANIFVPAGLGAVALLSASYFLGYKPIASQVPPMAQAPRELAASVVEAAPAEAPAPAPVAVTARDLPAPRGLGRPAHPDEVAAWNLDILPDGTGLPAGSGSVEDGEAVFADNCAACHGDFAEGVGNWPKLAGGEDTLANDDPLKTVGSYWPYLSTVFDYVRRSMPFGAAQTISDDDVYAITAYILYSNFLVEDDFVLSNENFLEVEMPNAGGFIVDDRAVTEYPNFTTASACYTDCKDPVTITRRASVLDVTPQTESATDAPTEETPAPAVDVAAAPAADPAPEPEPAPADGGGLDAALVAAGEAVFKKCAACHQVGPDAQNKTGPVLNGVYMAPVAHIPGFRYSSDLVAAGEAGRVWDDALLAEFLAKPKDVFQRTRMTFAGLRSDDDIAAMIEYLKSVSP